MTAPRDAVLGSLVPQQRALVVPLTMDGFAPGLAPYEALVGPVRGSRLEVFGLSLPWGIVSERSLQLHPEILRVGSSTTERQARREASVRIRAWLDAEAVRFGRIALLTYGPMMPVWSRAARGSQALRRVRLVPVHRRGGLRDTLLVKRLQRAVRG